MVEEVNNEDVAESLEEENSRLKETIERLTNENEKLQSEVSRLTLNSHEITNKHTGVNTLCILEDVYGELVAEIKKEIVHNIRKETDETSRALLEKHEKIKEEVVAIRQQSLALQEQLHAAVDGQESFRSDDFSRRMSASRIRTHRCVEENRCAKDPLCPSLSNIGSVSRTVPPIDYYLMRGDCALAESFQAGPETPDFLKSRRSVFSSASAIPSLSKNDIKASQRLSQRPMSSFMGGIQGQRKPPTKFRPLTSTQIHKEFLQRKLNPFAAKHSKRRPVSYSKQVDPLQRSRRPKMQDYIANI